MSNSLSDLFVMSYFKIQLLFYQNKTNCCFLFHHHYYKRKTWRLHFGPSITIGVFLINPSSHSCGFKQLIDWFHQGLQIVSLYVYMFKTGCSIKNVIFTIDRFPFACACNCLRKDINCHFFSGTVVHVYSCHCFISVQFSLLYICTVVTAWHVYSCCCFACVQLVLLTGIVCPHLPFLVKENTLFCTLSPGLNTHI